MVITLMTTMMLMMMAMMKMHLKNVFKSWSSDLNKSLPGSRHHPDQDHHCSGHRWDLEHNHHHPDHHHRNNDNYLLRMICVIRSTWPLEGYDGLSQLFNHMYSTTFQTHHLYTNVWQKRTLQQTIEPYISTSSFWRVFWIKRNQPSYLSRVCISNHHL